MCREIASDACSVEHGDWASPGRAVAPRCARARRPAAAPARTAATGAAASAGEHRSTGCATAVSMARAMRAASALRLASGRCASTAPCSVRTTDRSSRSSSDGAKLMVGSSPLSVWWTRQMARPSAARTASIMASGSLVRRRRVGDGLENGRQVADRARARAAAAAARAGRRRCDTTFGHQLLDQLRRDWATRSTMSLVCWRPSRSGRNDADDLRQVRRQRGRRIDDGVAGRARAVALVGGDPPRGQAERRLARLRPVERRPTPCRG